MREGPIIIPCATEADWHARRKEALGASEIAALVGENPYTTPLQLWSRKKLDRGDVLEDTEALLAGKFLEAGNAAWYAHAHGVRVITPQEYYGQPFAYAVIVRHPTLPIQCTPDRFILGPDGEPRVLQLKNVSHWLLDRWSDGDAVTPPLSVQIQVQVEMLCTGIPRGAIGAIVGGNKRMDAPAIDKHDAFLDRLSRLAFDFWKSLDGDVAPPAMAGDLEHISHLFPKSVPGLSKELERPEILMEYARCKAEIAELEKSADAYKAQLEFEIGPAESFTVKGQPGGTFKTVTRNEKAREARTTEYRQLRIDTSITKQAKALSSHEHAALPQ